jgi:hypothetical protein
MLYPDNIPGIQKSIIDRANVDFYNQVLVSGFLDLVNIEGIFEAQMRVELQLLINSDPKVSHHWPNKYSLCGYVV